VAFNNDFPRNGVARHSDSAGEYFIHSIHGGVIAMPDPDKRAIVIGASMGGLLAARALADHYGEVIIVERDALPEGYEPRKGVPQGRHTHGLLARGREVLEQLFPGFTEELFAQGATSGDLVDKILWFNHGFYLCNAPSKLLGLAISRPMLEGSVRRRLLQLPNVRLLERCAVLEPTIDRDRGRVTGVQVQSRGGSDGAEKMSCDLVVDASGRGSSSPAWLDGWGYPKPREELIKINIGYATRQYRRLPEHLGGMFGAIIAACPPDWRFGALLSQEGDRWIVSLGGYLGDYAPTDESGFLDFARSLQKPEIFEVIRDAEPLCPLMSYQFNASLRRRYEELPRFPAGFLVFGDALSSFNPIYGQGMTVACVESLALSECLAAGTQDVAKRFFRAASRLIDIPWQIAVGSDLQHPRVEGVRTTQVRFINWYIRKLFRAAQVDAVLANRFLEVANLMRQPSALLDPRIAFRVWKRNHAPVGAVKIPLGRTV
jgi:2-polyprenyl-6-methoxyphenol hydroxylase-like FAD-dependent oxidoreductase